MIFWLEIATAFLVAIAMALALAHALELPGKLRLAKSEYLAVQPIYYPGFTIGGFFGEGLGMVFALVLVLLTPRDSPAFVWTLIGFAALLAMHAAYWVLTHPVNKFWLKGQRLDRLGGGFFGIGGAAPEDGADPDMVWVRFRNRWEYSHVARAVLAAIALLSLLIALAL
jgi:hypothetical protein